VTPTPCPHLLHAELEELEELEELYIYIQRWQNHLLHAELQELEELRWQSHPLRERGGCLQLMAFWSEAQSMQKH